VIQKFINDPTIYDKYKCTSISKEPKLPEPLKIPSFDLDDLAQIKIKSLHPHIILLIFNYFALSNVSPIGVCKTWNIVLSKFYLQNIVQNHLTKICQSFERKYYDEEFEATIKVVIPLEYEASIQSTTPESLNKIDVISHASVKEVFVILAEVLQSTSLSPHYLRHIIARLLFLPFTPNSLLHSTSSNGNDIHWYIPFGTNKGLYIKAVRYIPYY